MTIPVVSKKVNALSNAKNSIPELRPASFAYQKKNNIIWKQVLEHNFYRLHIINKRSGDATNAPPFGFLAN